jgi:hypothetical protein
LKGFRDIYGIFPIKSDEIVVGLVTKSQVGLGLRELDSKEGASKKVSTCNDDKFKCLFDGVLVFVLVVDLCWRWRR